MPTGRFAPPHALLAAVHLADRAGESDRLGAVVRRWPAGSVATPELMPEGAHLVVDADGPLTGMLAMADIVVHHSPRDAGQWIARTLRALPGCLLALARDADRDGDYDRDREDGTGHGGWLLGTAGGELVRLRTRCADPTVFASVVYAWLAAGRRIDALPAELVVWPTADQSSSDSRCWIATARAEKPRVT